MGVDIRNFIEVKKDKSYSFFLCVCVAGHQSVDCVQIMRWWSSNLGQ